MVCSVVEIKQKCLITSVTTSVNSTSHLTYDGCNVEEVFRFYLSERLYNKKSCSEVL